MTSILKAIVGGDEPTYGTLPESPMAVKGSERTEMAYEGLVRLGLATGWSCVPDCLNNRTLRSVILWGVLSEETGGIRFSKDALIDIAEFMGISYADPWYRVTTREIRHGIDRRLDVGYEAEVGEDPGFTKPQLQAIAQYVIRESHERGERE